MKISVIVTFAFLAFVFAIGVLFGRQMPIPPKIEYQYRYFGDKAKPDEWLHKYSIPTRYYVWIDDLGHYEEVTEEEYKAVPPNSSLKTRKP